MSLRAKLSERHGFPISRALLANYRSSPFKARLVADLIRYKGVVEAINILVLTQKRVAKTFLKVLRSALANAINNHGMELDGLYVFRVTVNEAKTLKRWRPILRGRTAKIRKRGCHIEILLAQKFVETSNEFFGEGENYTTTTTNVGEKNVKTVESQNTQTTNDKIEKKFFEQVVVEKAEMQEGVKKAETNLKEITPQKQQKRDNIDPYTEGE